MGIRDPAEQSSSELIQPHGYGHDTSSEFDREAKAQRNKEEMKQKLQEMAFKEKQAKISQMAERNDAIREQSGMELKDAEIIPTGHEDNERREEQIMAKQEQQEQKKQEMMNEMERMAKEQLNKQTEKM